MSERQGIEIRLPKCRGLWLERREIDKIMERSTSAEAQARPLSLYTFAMGGHHGRAAADRSCRISSIGDVAPGLAQPGRRSSLPVIVSD